MTRMKMFAVAAILAVLLLAGCASANQITIQNIQVNSGGTATADVVIDEILPAEGWQGFTITFTMSDPSVAQVSGVTYPSGMYMFTDTTTLPFTSGHISGVDLSDDPGTMPAGGTNIVLATLTFTGLSPGSTTMAGTITQLDGRTGSDLISLYTISSPTIDVYDTVTANFAGDNLNPTVSIDPVQFTDQSTGNPTSYFWDFGEGRYSYDKDPSYMYNTTGLKTVSLTVSNPYPSTDTKTIADYINVVSQPLPDADFTVTATNAVGSVTPVFTQSSTGTIDTYTWEYRIADNGAWTEFGGGAAEPSGIAFTDVGTYDIRLTVSNSGGSDSLVKAHQFAVGNVAEELSLVQSGTVSGDLFIESPHTYASGVTEVTHTFTLPAEAVGSNVQWARLYVNTYSGSAAGTYGLTSTVEFNGNTLGVETMDIASIGSGASFPLNDHVTKVYSDYEAQYDVTGLITSASPVVHVRGEAISGLSFDGRIKGITLAVAYNDGDSDTVQYWVNHGQQYVPSGNTGSTTFDASGISSGWTSAATSIRFHSSSDAEYAFNGVSIASGTSPDTGGLLNTWDVTSGLVAGTNNLAFTKSTSYSYKATLATLKARYVVPPAIASFTTSKSPSSVGETVTFNAAATSDQEVTWDIDYGDGTMPHGTATGLTASWTHPYSAADTYSVTVTATNEGGTDTEIVAQVVVDKPILSFDPTPQTLLPGESRVYTIVMDRAPTGLAGYDMVVSLDTGSVADITGVTFPAWAQLTHVTPLSGSLPADSVRISAIDSTQMVLPGAVNLVIANVTVRGTSAGNSQIALSSVKMDADGGAALDPVLTVGEINVNSYGGPVASFSGTPQTGDSPLTVIFTDSSSGTITTRQWDFGDGNSTWSTSETTFAHTYENIGTYNVKLTVSGPGGSNTFVQNAYITVTDGVAPTVSIVANSYSGNYPKTVTFSANTTGSITGYQWNFGDGITSTVPEALVTHTYTYPDDFSATLTVTGPGGSATSDPITIHVTDDAPVAYFIATPNHGTAPLFVQFYDQSAHVVYGTAGTTYLWQYSDDGGLTWTEFGSGAQNPAMTFNSADIFKVRLTVTEGSEVSMHEEEITTTGLAVDFEANVLSGVASTEHAFTTVFTADADPSAGVTYTWDFGDGNTSVTTSPTISHSYYGRLMSFTVTVTADNGADVASKTKTGYITTTPFLEAFPMYNNAGTITGYYANIPQDHNLDYVYEDVNGNGRVDYDDVVAFYNALYYDWFTTNTDVDNVPDYDYTGNGTLTTNDVVALYDMVLYS